MAPADDAVARAREAFTEAARRRVAYLRLYPGEVYNGIDAAEQDAYDALLAAERAAKGGADA